MAKRPKLAGMVRERGNSRSLIFRYQGKQYSKAVHTKTKREAQAMLPAFVASVISGEFGRKQEAARSLASAPTVREAFEIYLRDYLRPDLDGASTRHVYSYAARVLARQIGDRRAGDVTTSELQRVLRDLHQNGRTYGSTQGAKGLAIATVRSVHAALNRVFGQLVELGTVPANPVPHFSKLNLGRGEPSSAREKHLTRPQVAALLAACVDPALRLWVQVMAGTTARPGEALALRWADIGLDTVSVMGSAKPSGIRGQRRIGTTKTRGSVRTVPIGTTLALALAQERSRQETLLRGLSGIPGNVELLQPLLQTSDCVFPSDVAERREVPMSMETLRDRFRRAVKQAGLPVRTTPHWCRHSAITAMVAGNASRPGISVVDAARIAGHSNPATTMRTYAHALPENLRRGAALADDLLAPIPAAEVERLPNNGTPSASGSSDR